MGSSAVIDSLHLQTLDVKVFVDGKAWTCMEQLSDPINVQPSSCYE